MWSPSTGAASTADTRRGGGHLAIPVALRRCPLNQEAEARGPPLSDGELERDPVVLTLLGEDPEHAAVPGEDAGQGLPTHSAASRVQLVPGAGPRLPSLLLLRLALRPARGVADEPSSTLIIVASLSAMSLRTARAGWTGLATE
jgi:hypothetical protein